MTSLLIVDSSKVKPLHSRTDTVLGVEKYNIIFMTRVDRPSWAYDSFLGHITLVRYANSCDMTKKLVHASTVELRWYETLSVFGLRDAA